MERKKIDEPSALARLTSLCATAEYCTADIRKKMQRWLLPDGAEDRIIQYLIKERYVDEARYARAFTRDKFRYNRWGWVRIKTALMQKGISDTYIEDAHEEIDEEDALDTLRQLIETKRKSVKGKSEYEINGKLIRFALSRGFQMDDIMRVVKPD